MAADKPTVNRPRSYSPWSGEEDRKLIEKREKGMQVSDLAKVFARTPSAIRSRLRTLGLK